MKSGGGASAAGLRPVAWFDCPGGGQVVVDGHVACCSNDVWVDDRGLLYLIDRGRGLHILERG